jgi:hypothetical protein
MEKIKNKRFYKVISLLIKSVILIFSFFNIWQKIKVAEKGIDFSQLFSSSNLIILLIVYIFYMVDQFCITCMDRKHFGPEAEIF